MSLYAIGIDVGGTRVRGGLVSNEGHILARRAVATRHDAGPEGVIHQIVEMAQQLMDEASLPVAGVGVAVPGAVNPYTGVVRFAPNLPGWHDLPVRSLLASHVQSSVFLGNDANLAAVAEHRFGAGRGYHHLIYITVSTGIGGGIIVDNRLLLGHHGYAAEIGHHTVKEDGPRCKCGNIGCLEALASGTAIAREARVAVATGVPTRLRDLCAGDIWRLNAAHVVQAANAGDEVAKRILEQAGHYLGVGILNLLHMFNPQRVILGGGVMQAGEWITRPMWAVLHQRLHSGYLENCDIVLAALGDNVGILGAAALVFQERGGTPWTSAS